MAVSAIESYRELLNALDNASALRAAAFRAAGVVLGSTCWHWVDLGYDANAPRVLRELADQQSWRRFEADTFITRKQVAAHCLFRAASHVEDDDARALLFFLARKLVAEIVQEWEAGWAAYCETGGRM